MTPRFDPTRAIIYDLARGQLKDEEGAARVNLPVHLLLRLCEEAGEEASRDFAHSLGSEIGRRIRDRMGDAAMKATIESWTEHLGGQFALIGLGDLSVERWGRALVVRITGAPQGSQQLLGLILGSALQRALGRQPVPIAFNDPESVSFLIVSHAAAAKAYVLAAQGQGLGQVVEALHRGAA
jgi:hypothetical protein